MDLEDKANLAKLSFIPISINDYLESVNEVFNIIILSNVYHYYADGRERIQLLKSIKTKLSKDGILLIRVAGEGHSVYREAESVKVVFSSSRLLVEARCAGLNAATKVYSRNNNTNLSVVFRKAVTDVS